MQLILCLPADSLTVLLLLFLPFSCADIPLPARPRPRLAVAIRARFVLLGIAHVGFISRVRSRFELRADVDNVGSDRRCRLLHLAVRARDSFRQLLHLLLEVIDRAEHVHLAGFAGSGALLRLTSCGFSLVASLLLPGE